MTKVITLSELVANIRCRRAGKTFLANFVNQCEFRDAVVIQPNATNGDAIMAMFPDAEIDYHEKSDLVDRHVTVYIKGCDTCQDYSYEWWNAPYMESEG